MRFPKLPFMPGSNAWKHRFREAMERGEKPVEVNCFGDMRYELVGYAPIVRIYNEKMGRWEDHIGVEYRDICPVCGRLMLVRAIKGTTWLALCSEECYRKFDELRRKMKDE